MLRSASAWSMGYPEGQPEHSIWNAYVHDIENAKHFIYIENQFFISEIQYPLEDPDSGNVRNTIARALIKRILRAYHSN
jgi:phospholipase D1/2